MCEEIKPGIFKIDVPLPKNPLKATNSYFIKGHERNLLIDTGMNIKACIDALNSALNSLEANLEYTDFFITHLHADHLGLAFHLAKNNSKIYFNNLDAEIINDHTFWDRASKIALTSGFPENKVEEAALKHPGKKYSPPETKDFHFVKEEDTIEIGNYKLKCIETPGHTPGNTCLYEEEKKLFFSGDHVLWDITPNISAFLEKGNNPLKKYLTSLEKVKKLDVQLVLPGHRNFFSELSTRVNQLKEHHFKRIEEIENILKTKGEQNAYQIASKMTWDLNCNSWKEFPLVQKWFATGEALAHLEYMEKEGVIKNDIKDETEIYYL